MLDPDVSMIRDVVPSAPGCEERQSDPHGSTCALA
jgi:hypothetical protein